MNNFQSIESGEGLLKNFYDSGSKERATAEALKRRRKKLYESQTGESTNIEGESNGD